MRAITRILAGSAAIAAFAAAAPAAAQYYPGYGYGAGPYGYAPNREAVVNQCAGAVQARLGGYGYRYGGGRVLGISSVSPRDDGGITVRGVASSGRYGGYGYGYGAQAPDLTWRCRTGFRGEIREVTINRAGYNYGYGNYTPWDYSQYGYRRY